MPSHRLANSLATLGLMAAISLAWLGTLDEVAQTQTETALKRALLTYAVARSLNGAISVAQGTEIALQPAGIGVTLTPGEILDPLNDLIERFSWLALMAATSLGVQSLLTEVFAHQGLNIVLTVLLLGLTVAVWLRNQQRIRKQALRLAVILIVVRFSFAVVALLSSLLGDVFLLEKEQQSSEYLSSTQVVIDSVQVQETYTAPDAPDAKASWLDKFSGFFDEHMSNLDIQNRLARLQTRTEKAVDHVISLMVVFLVRTLLLPLAVFYGVVVIIRSGWRKLST